MAVFNILFLSYVKLLSTMCIYLSYTHHEEEHMNHISNTTEPSSASAKASPAADMLSATWTHGKSLPKL